jgi:hypothetical protein
MAEKKQTKTGRTQVKELPKSEKELGKSEQKKVKGGGRSGGEIRPDAYKPKA